MASEHSPGMPPSPLEPPPGGEEWPRAYPSRPPTGPYPPYPAVPYIPPMQQVPKGRRGGVPWYVWVIGGCLGLLVLLVIACVVFAGVFTGIAIKYSRQVAVTDTTSQTLPTHGVPTLDIRDSYGTVTLQQGSGKQVTVRITRIARDASQAEAQKDLAGMGVDVSSSGGMISITTSFATNGNLLGTSSEVDLSITTPANTNLTAIVDGGRVDVAGLAGLMDVSVDAGAVQLRDVTFADGSRVRMSGGQAQLQGKLAKNASLDINVLAGQVRLQLPASTVARLRASVTSGTIEVAGWPITPTSTNGTKMSASGDLGTNPTGTISIQVETGDIVIEQT